MTKAKHSETALSLSLDVGTFRRMAGAIVHAVPKDKDRPLMSCLHVLQKDDRLTYEATNGHWFARWGTDHPAADAEFVIPGERLQSFLKLLPRDENQLHLFDAQLVFLEPKKMRGPGVVLDYAPPEGEYPALGKLVDAIPTGRRSGMSRIALTPDYVACAARVFDAAGCNAMKLEIGPGPSDVVLLGPADTSDVDGLLVGIMPHKPVEEEAKAAE